jgi:hypothetical protein
VRDSIDLDFRPDSYWDAPRRKRANVKGHLRRRLIAAAEAVGDTDSIPPEMREDSISEASKIVLQHMHPSYRSGEDLPDSLENEVEIARLANTYTVFCEVTSIRARRQAGRIRYRVVDEYESKIRCARKESVHPLALREVIELIDTATVAGLTGLYFCTFEVWWRENEEWWLSHPESSPTEWAGNIEVSSTFYPQLGLYYEEAFKAWCEAKHVERSRKNAERARKQAGRARKGAENA